MTRTLMVIGFFVYLLCFAAVAWAQEARTETLTVKIGANVTAYCIAGDDRVKCEDIPVFELTEDDYEEPPTPEEQWAAVVEWRGY